MTDDGQTSSDASQQSQDSAPKRRRHWPFYVLLFTPAVLVLGYVLLPWLIPVAWVRDQVVAGIKDQFGRSASIAAMEISWTEGIIVRDITIERLEEFGSGPFFKAARLQMDFRPLRMLFNRRLGTVRIDRPQVWIITERAGRLNLASLGEPAKPAGFDIIQITNADLHFIDQLHNRQGLLSIPVFRVARDQDTGRYTVLAQGESSTPAQKPSFTLEVDYCPDSGDVAKAKGSAKLVWTDFDISSVPLPRLGKMDCQVLEGRSSGLADIELYSDGRIELRQCTTETRNLHLKLTEILESPDSPEGSADTAIVSIPQAGFHLRGSYEFISGQLDIAEVSCSIDGLELKGFIHGRLTDHPRAFLPSSFHLAVTIQPGRLREQFPSIDRMLLDHDLTVTGSTDMEIDFSQAQDFDRLSLSLSSRQAGLHIPSLLHKSAGIPCGLSFEAEIDHSTERFTLTKPLICELALSRFTLRMQSAQPLPDVSLPELLASPVDLAQLATDQLANTTIDASVQIEHLEELATIFPPLTELLSRTKLAGPARASLLIKPFLDERASSVALPDQPPTEDSAPASTKIEASLELPAQTSLEVAPYFRKPSDAALSLAFAGRLAQSSWRLDNVNLSCSLGQMSLSLLNGFFALQPEVKNPADSVGESAESSQKPHAKHSGELSPDLLGSLKSIISEGTQINLSTAVSAGGEFQLLSCEVLMQAINADVLERLKISGDIAGHYSLDSAGGEPVRLALALDATDFACEVFADAPPNGDIDHGPASHFRKIKGIPAQMDLQVLADIPLRNNLRLSPADFKHLFRADAPAFAFKAALKWNFADSAGSLDFSRGNLSQVALASDPTNTSIDAPDATRFELNLSRLDLRSIDEYFPGLQRSFLDYQIGGSAAVELSGLLGRDLFPRTVDISVDLTEAAWTLGLANVQSSEKSPVALMRKPSGLTATFLAKLRTEPPSPQNYRATYVDSLEMNLANSQLELSASALLAFPIEQLFEQLGSNKNRLLEFLSKPSLFIWAKFQGQGSIPCDEDMLNLFGPLAKFAEKQGLKGVLDLSFDTDADTSQVSSRLSLRAGTGGLQIGQLEFEKADHKLQLFLDPAAERLTVSAASIEIPEFRLKASGQPIQFSADIGTRSGQVDIRRISLGLGDYSLRCTGRLENIRTNPSGRMYIYSPLIDQMALMDLVTATGLLAQQPSTGAEVSQQPLPSDSAGNTTDISKPTSTADEELPPADPEQTTGDQVAAQEHQRETSTPGSAAQQPGESFHLPPMNINLNILMDRFVFKDPFSPQLFDFRQVAFDVRLTSASVLSEFTAAWNGGRLEGLLNIFFDEPGTPLVYQYEALELLADEQTAPMISRVFPDMTVIGTITESRRILVKLQPPAGKQEFASEQGRTILKDGKLVGPSAPAWVTYWFPSLSLTEYPFDVADNIFQRSTKNGTLENDMVFLGKGKYNIYIKGKTMIDNTTDYRMGVDLSSKDLEHRHELSTWRFPLLGYTGKIADGKWLSQTVSFVWPTRTATEVLITKNPVIKTMIEQYRRGK